MKLKKSLSTEASFSIPGAGIDGAKDATRYGRAVRMNAEDGGRVNPRSGVFGGPHTIDDFVDNPFRDSTWIESEAGNVSTGGVWLIF